MKPHDWTWTKYYEDITSDNVGPIKIELNLRDNELVIASTILSSSNWTFVTTKKVIGKVDNKANVIQVDKIDKWTWGDFKGDMDKRATRITLTTADGQTCDFVIEKGKASMVMIYAIQTLTRLTGGINGS